VGFSERAAWCLPLSKQKRKTVDVADGVGPSRVEYTTDPNLAGHEKVIGSGVAPLLSGRRSRTGTPSRSSPRTSRLAFRGSMAERSRVRASSASLRASGGSKGLRRSREALRRAGRCAWWKLVRPVGFADPGTSSRRSTCCQPSSCSSAKAGLSTMLSSDATRPVSDGAISGSFFQLAFGGGDRELAGDQAGEKEYAGSV
jgi:hypothetical protein